MTSTSTSLQELQMWNKNGCKGNLKKRKFLKVSSFVQVTRHLSQMDTLYVSSSLLLEVFKEDIMKTLQHFHSHQSLKEVSMRLRWLSFSRKSELPN